MSQTVARELFQYILRLDEAEQKTVLEMLKTFVRGRELPGDFTTIEQYNKELEIAERQIEQGDYVTQDDLEEEMKQW